MKTLVVSFTLKDAEYDLLASRYLDYEIKNIIAEGGKLSLERAISTAENEVWKSEREKKPIISKKLNLHKQSREA